MGVLQIVATIRLRMKISSARLLILGCLASVLFGVLLMAQSVVGVLSLIWLIASYAVVFDILLYCWHSRHDLSAPPLQALESHRL